MSDNKLFTPDNSEQIFNLIHSGSRLLLLRPSGFGKSTLQNNIKAYFQGQRDYFNKQNICYLEKQDAKNNKRKQWVKYPVFSFSFDFSTCESLQNVLDIIDRFLFFYESMFGETDSIDLATRFYSLIQRAYKETQRKCVVLIDDYDSFLDLQGKISNFTKLIVFLKDFYSVIDKTSEYIEFVFITGKTKNPRIDILSMITGLKDISMNLEYSTLCGLTEENILSLYKEQINEILTKKRISKADLIELIIKECGSYKFSSGPELVFNYQTVQNYLVNNLISSEITLDYKELITPKTIFFVKTLINTNELRCSDPFFISESDSDPASLFFVNGLLTIKSFDINTNEYILEFSNSNQKKIIEKLFIQFNKN